MATLLRYKRFAVVEIYLERAQICAQINDLRNFEDFYRRSLLNNTLLSKSLEMLKEYGI